ncbi:hypothetical protein V1478_012411 [Vespula squamosa]|uniref:Uncharacterized protein n=1 Tax=Vespula squamosa TaxID=30214 RepID=A0ABD2AFR7_VESSQ
MKSRPGWDTPCRGKEKIFKIRNKERSCAAACGVSRELGSVQPVTTSWHCAMNEEDPSVKVTPYRARSDPVNSYPTGSADSKFCLLENNKESRSEKWNGVGAFTRIQIGSFCRSSSRLKRHLRSSDRLASSIAAATTHRKTGLEYDDYKGVLAFCGNNQQVVAKQGYECISSAVNTVARHHCRRVYPDTGYAPSPVKRQRWQERRERALEPPPIIFILTLVTIEDNAKKRLAFSRSPWQGPRPRGWHESSSCSSTTDTGQERCRLSTSSG